MQTTYKINSELIKRELADKFMSFSDLSKTSGVSYPTIISTVGKKDGRRANSNTVCKIAHALNFSPKDIILTDGGEK